MERAETTADITANLAACTGRSLEQWLDVVASSGLDPADQAAVRAWLTDEHGVSSDSRRVIAEAAARAAGRVPPGVEEATEALYRDAPALSPLHDAIVEMTHALGDDVQVQACGTHIALVRRTQFLAVAPGPRGTLRLGLRFRGDVPADARLRPLSGFAQATHVVDVDADLLDAQLLALEPLIAAAYDQNG